MASRGTKPKPVLQVVREGNPGHRPLNDPVVLPPTALREPDWSAIFCGSGDENDRARATAAALWAKTAPVLSRCIGLVGEQQEALADFCVTWARIEQGERALSREGVVTEGYRGGPVHNPWATALHQYRSHARSLAGELGLTPASLTRLRRPEGVDDDDPFD